MYEIAKDRSGLVVKTFRFALNGVGSSPSLGVGSSPTEIDELDLLPSIFEAHSIDGGCCSFYTPQPPLNLHTPKGGSRALGELGQVR